MSKKNRKKPQKSRRSLVFESLECRRVMAGNVTANLSGGDLVLTGDALGNQVFVQRPAGNRVVISALDGTTTINGQGSVTFNGNVRSISANMGDGDDIVHIAGKFRNRWTLSSVNVDTGAGNDIVLLQHLQVAGGRTTITTGAGNDAARISKSRHSSGVSIDLGAGGDDSGVYASRFAGNVAVNGGDGSDRFVREGGKAPGGIDQTSIEGVVIPATLAPALDLDAGTAGSNFTTTFTPGAGPQAVVSSTATLTDADSTNLTSLTATIANRPDGASEVLAATTTGTPITASFNNGVLTLSGAATVAQYQQVLRTITYNNTDTTPDTAARTINFVANDGTNASNTATTTLNFSAAGAPVIDLDTATAGTGFTTTFTPGGGPQAVVASSATITDSNSPNLTSLTATIVNRPDGASEVLAATTTGTPITAAFSNGVLTLSGAATVAQYQQVLRTITYNNTDASIDPAARTINFVANDGTNTSNTATTTVNIGAAGAPVIDLDASTAGTGFSATFTPGSGPQSVVASNAVITDSNSTNLTSLTATIVNRPDGASEVLAATTTGTPITATFNNGVLTLTGAATVAQYQQVLRTITYNNTDASIDTTARTINFVASDGANTSNTAVTTLNLGAAAPAIDLDASTAGSGFSTNFTPGGGPQAVVAANATLTDSSSTNLTQLTATIVNRPDGASEVLAATTTGTPITATFSNGVLTLSGAATVAQYQQVLRTITYNNTDATPDTSTRTINFVASDGTNTSNTATTTLTIGAAPAIDLNGSEAGTGFAATFTTGGGPVNVADSDATLTDANSTNLASLTVTIVNRPDGASEILAATTVTGVTSTFNNGVLTLTGSATVEQYQTMLRSVTYNNTDGTPTTTPRTITFVASDGTNNSNTATTTVTIVTAANAPVVDLNGAEAGTGFSSSFTEGGAAAAVADSDATIADSDSTNLSQVTVTLVSPPDGASELLAATTTGTPITANFAGGVLTLSGAATVAQYQQVLRTVTYTNSSNNPTAGSRTINVVASDGTNNSAVATATIGVTAANDAPALDLDADDSSGQTGGNFAASFTEGGGPVAVAGTDATLTDLDSANLTSLTVTITNLQNGASEVLSANAGATGINVAYVSATGTLNLTGTATVAQYQQVLRTVTYNNTADDPGLTARSITFVANDGSADSNTATTTLSVSAANDAPLLDLDADDSSGQTGANFAATFTSGGGPVGIADADASLSDVDSANLASLIVTITNRQDGANEILAANTSGTSITASFDADTGVLTLSGSDTVANYQQVLRSITYNNTATTPTGSSRSITFVASDGVADSNIGTTNLTIDINP
jgi:HSP20 family molecular chaperone IbpA